MTQHELRAMLRLAGVGRSKVVEVLYPFPQIIVHVPAIYMLIVSDVVLRMKLTGQVIDVTKLESDEVADGQHLFVKVHNHVQTMNVNCDAAAPEEWKRNRRRVAQISRNRGVVIDCALMA